MNNINSPLVSVIICTFNRAPLLVLSIKSALAQTHPNLEVIVLDDASTDNTEEVVKSFNDYRITYIKNESNLGITKNRNKALAYAKGVYVAPLDSDDWWHDPRKIEKQVFFMETEKNKQVAVVGTQANITDQNARTLFTTHFALINKKIKNRMMLFNQLMHSTTLIRKSMLVSINNEGDIYDPSVPIWEDWDLFMCLGVKHELANLPDITTSYLKHDGNISKISQEKDILASTMILKRYKPYYPFYFIGIWRPIIKKQLFKIRRYLSKS